VLPKRLAISKDCQFVRIGHIESIEQKQRLSSAAQLPFANALSQPAVRHWLEMH
jgi:hypothetical protein